IRDLKTLLTRVQLRALAGATSFERGEKYFANGHVTDLVEHSGTLSATVQARKTIASNCRFTSRSLTTIARARWARTARFANIVLPWASPGSRMRQKILRGQTQSRSLAPSSLS